MSCESREPNCNGESRIDCAQHRERIRLLERERDDALKEALDRKTQLCALVEATRLLTRLVTNPLAVAHQAPAISPNVECIHSVNEKTITRQDAASTTTSGGVLEEEKLLADLLQDSKFEETGFSGLFNGCKMLCDNLRLTAIEADDALDEMRATHKVTEEVEADLRAKLKSTSKALSKLYKENSKLKKERKKLARKMCEYVGELNRHEEDKHLNEAYALIAHEQALSPISKASNTYSFDGEEEGTTLLAFPPVSPASNSLVTDDGAATVRFTFHDDDTSTVSVTASSHASTHLEVVTKKEVPLSAESLLGGEVAFEGEDDVESEGLIPAGDLIGMLMNREVHRDLYHIDFFSSHIGLRLRAIPAHNRGGKKCSTCDPSSPDSMVESSTNKPAQHSFIVIGFRDYDLALEKRPELGARLVAVDDTSVEYGIWTLKSVCDKIRSRTGGVRLSFRNDTMSKKDITYLNKILAPKTKRDLPELTETRQETSDQFFNVSRKTQMHSKLSSERKSSSEDVSEQKEVSPQFRLQYRKGSPKPYRD